MTSITPFARQLKSRLQTATGCDELVHGDEVAAACAAGGHRWRACFWTPTVTILTFLRQILHGNCSCRQAVAMTLAPSATQEGSAGDEAVSGDPSAYSQARLHSSLNFLRPVDYYRGNPEALLAERRRKLTTARDLRKQENLKLRQRLLPYPAAEIILNPHRRFVSV